MFSFHDAHSIAASPTLVPDPGLQRLLSERVQQWCASELLEMTHLLVIEAGDTEGAVQAEVGFSPLVNPLDGERFGSASFHPFWDWLQDHGGWFELIVTVGNSGFAFVLFIQSGEGTDPKLLALCRTYCREGQATCTGL